MKYYCYFLLYYLSIAIIICFISILASIHNRYLLFHFTLVILSNILNLVSDIMAEQRANSPEVITNRARVIALWQCNLSINVISGSNGGKRKGP